MIEKELIKKEPLNVHNIECFACKQLVNDKSKFCTTCAYPIKGTTLNKKKFMVQKRMNEKELKEEELAAGAGRSLMFTIGGFYMAWALYTNLIVYEFNLFNFSTDLIEASVFIGLAIWAKKKPFPATFSGLIFFTTMFVIGIINNPYSALLIGFKSLFFIVFIVSIFSVRKAEKLKKEIIENQL